MLRTTILIGAVLSIMASTACDKASDDQQKANSAQATASETITSAKLEADKKIATAQIEADKKINEAQTSFMKLREDYRHKTTVNLADLDAKIDTLSSKEKMATGKARTDLDANLTQIRASRAQFAADYNALDNASASTWDTTQARLDKEWSDLKALVDKS